MKKKLFKYIKITLAITLIGALTLPSYAAVNAADGSAFVTKAEFDAALSDFNARLTTFEAGINSKIDSQVSSYLDRNGIWSGKNQEIGNFTDATKKYFIADYQLLNQTAYAGSKYILEYHLGIIPTALNTAYKISNVSTAQAISGTAGSAKAYSTFYTVATGDKFYWNFINESTKSGMIFIKLAWCCECWQHDHSWIVGTSGKAASGIWAMTNKTADEISKADFSEIKYIDSNEAIMNVVAEDVDVVKTNSLNATTATLFNDLCFYKKINNGSGVYTYELQTSVNRLSLPLKIQWANGDFSAQGFHHRVASQVVMFFVSKGDSIALASRWNYAARFSEGVGWKSKDGAGVLELYKIQECKVY